MVAVIFGIPGVGKSSVIQELLKIEHLEHLYLGGMFEEIAKQENLIQTIDDIRHLSVTKQKHLQNLVAVKLTDVFQDRSKHYLVETHAALKTDQGYLPGLYPEVLKVMKPDTFVVIQAPPERIFTRRQNDPTRKRDDDRTLEDVKENMEMTRNYARVFTILSRATLTLVENKENDLAYATGIIEQIFRKFMES